MKEPSEDEKNAITEAICEQAHVVADELLDLLRKHKMIEGKADVCDMLVSACALSELSGMCQKIAYDRFLLMGMKRDEALVVIRGANRYGGKTTETEHIPTRDRFDAGSAN